MKTCVRTTMQWAAAGVLAMGLVTTTYAQGPGGPGGPDGQRGPSAHKDMGGMHDGGPGMEGRLLPPGTWWRNQDVVTKIGLSAEQQKHIDQIFLDSRVQLVHMHASLEEAEIRLDDALHATTFDQQKAASQIDAIADMRASLEKANAHMLLSIRGVLTADQFQKLMAAGPHGGPQDGHGPSRHAGKGGPQGPGGNGPQAPPQGPPNGEMM